MEIMDVTQPPAVVLPATSGDGAWPGIFPAGINPQFYRMQK
jgi:hypothetical protein